MFFHKILGFFSNDLAIDLGTANTLVFVKDVHIMMGMDSNIQLSAMASMFDDLVAECSPQAQETLQKLAVWASDNILISGGGLMSAKELILSALLVEHKIINLNMRWNVDKGEWVNKARF